MAWLNPVTLAAERATAVPLEVSHAPLLIDAASDGELWRLWYTSVPTPAGMEQEIERRLELMAEGKMLPFTVIDRGSGKPAGMTTYMNIDERNRRLEIGSTWYRASLQRTGLNVAVKSLLLRYAFEDLNCIAVEFRTHFFNRQSRAAIERLGAKFDGILRSHQILPDGSLRDTCVYSIIQSEWPAVKADLALRLARLAERTPSFQASEGTV